MMEVDEQTGYSSAPVTPSGTHRFTLPQFRAVPFSAGRKRSPSPAPRHRSRSRSHSHRRRRVSPASPSSSSPSPSSSDSDRRSRGRSRRRGREVVPYYVGVTRQPQETAGRCWDRCQVGVVLQLAFNALVLVVLGLAVYQGYTNLMHDVEKKVDEFSGDILNEMAKCSRLYQDNGCAKEDKAPALEDICRAWENCMKRDPTAVARSKISAETLAEIVNGFVEPLSYKTMIFLALVVFGLFLLANLSCSCMQRRLGEPATDPRSLPPYYHQGSPPAPTVYYPHHHSSPRPLSDGQ